MFNAFNGQPGNYAAWQMGYGNLQGNYSAPTVTNSFPQPNGFQGPDPYGHYGAYQQQAGWQAPNPAVAYHQQQHQALVQQQYQYQYYSAPVQTEPPPLPDGAPPPLPPAQAEEPPPLPPDAPTEPAPTPTLLQNQPPNPPTYPSQNQPISAQAPLGVAMPEALGQFQPLQQSGGGPGQVPAPANAGVWNIPPQQGPYHHLGHASTPNPYPPFLQPPPQQPAPPLPQHTGFAQPPQQPHHHLPPMPPGTAAPAAAAPPYASSGAGVASHALQLPPPQASAPAPPTPVIIDITRLLRPPHRATRPRKLLLLLRGMPGSGKSTLARKIREAELEAGAEVPRLHSMDDYYMQEVEVEVVEEEGGRKKRRKVTELKYVYEPEMEGTYFRDLVRAVGRSCDDRRHSFVVVDAPLLRAEQLREVMAVGQRANFECFALLPLETDPAVCASPGRNVHGHSIEALREMAASFESAPPLYAQVSAVSLFGGPVVGEERDAKDPDLGPQGSEIQEVEMDADDSDDGADGAVDEAEGGSDLDDEDRMVGSSGRSGSERRRRRRPASRWHDDGGDDGDGGGDGARRLQRRKKRDKAKLRAVAADIDDKGILLGLNDALAASPATRGPPATRGAPNAKRAWGPPLRSALRRSSSVAATLSAGTAAAAAGSSSQRRVWWPDMGQGSKAAPEPGEAESSTAVAATSQLTEVVYLEGLGPPPELEDLPYGYQRRVALVRNEETGPSGEGGGGGAAAIGVAGGATGHHPHGSFRDQAKAEHESEHDLFRRLLLGKQVSAAAAGGRGAAGGGGSGGSQLGLFAAPLEEGEEEEEEKNCV